MNNRLHRTIKRIILFVVSLLLLFGNSAITTKAYNYFEEKIICDANIDDNFSEDTVIVVMKKSTSEINKKYGEDFFGNIPIENIYDVTYVSKEIKSNTSLNLDEFRQILQLKLKANTKQDVLKVIKEIEKIDDVLCVSPNYYIEMDKQPSSALTPASGIHRYPELWGLHSSVGINAEEAWDFTTGSSQVRVGVIDSGVYSHMDIAANVSTEGGDFVNMANVAENIPGPLRTDPTGHGTHVSGIIGATGTNANGVTGVSWNVKIIPLQASIWDDTANDWLLSSSAVIRAITWAANNNVDIINFSAGSNNDDPCLKNAISNFNGLFVAAAGNGGNDGIGDDNDSTRNYPSDYSREQTFSDRVISVGAYKEVSSGTSVIASICSFSNFGQNSVSVFAPGEVVLSCFPNNICNNYSYVFNDETRACEMSSSFLGQISELGPINWEYLDEHFSEIVHIPDVDEATPDMLVTSNHNGIGYHYMDGTSMATPYVTGTAAILWNIFINSAQNYTRSQIASMIKNSIINGATKNDIGTPFNDKCVADGRLNAFGAVKYVLENYLDSGSIFNLNCVSTIHSSTKNCSENNSIVYKVNIECPKSYKFISSALSPLDMTFYDSSFNEITSITPVMTNSNCTGTITTYLNPGTYYLRVNFVSGSSSGNITTSYQATWPVSLAATLNNNLNILNYLHLIDTNTYHCIISFNNIYGEKLFKFKLDAGNNATYSAGAIKVYTDSALTNQLDRYSVSGLTYPASSNAKENELYVFLPEKGIYYIEITVPRNDYNSLQFLVSNVDEMSINYLNTLATSTNTSVFSYKTEASYFKKVDISHKSKIKIELNSNTGCFNSTKLFIFKLNKDPGYDIGVNHYSLSSILQVNLTFDEDSYNTTLILDEGTYYIGYTNNINCSLNLNLRRLINTNVNMDGTLVADPMPNQRYTIGSEVLLNNGSYNNYNITEGFTRCIYLMNGNTLLEPSSRLLYDWYSSDDDVALVTQYGTVLAKSVNSNTNVIIYAILKEDPSVVYRKTFTILNDTLTYATSPIDIYVDMTIGANEYTPIDLSSVVVPINMLQYYSWSISQGGEIDYWGNIFAYTSSVGNTLYITGNYLYNPRVKVFVDAFVTLPMSGYELDYNPLLWDDEVEDNNNCYNYALNSQVIPGTNTLWYKQQPGQYSESMTYDYSDYDAMYTAVHNDFVKYNQIFNTNLIFTPIDKFAKCPEGTYKVALVACSDDWDYHWYRQDSDGYWSHKPGTDFVRRYDDSYDLIIDPSNCDWGDYDTFLGFFAVSPWNTMYTEPENMRTLGEANPSISLIDLDDIGDLEIGMSYYEVVQTLGSAGLDIGSGTLIQQYETTSNNIVLINYHLVNGEYVVASIDVE